MAKEGIFDDGGKSEGEASKTNLVFDWFVSIGKTLINEEI